MNFPADPMRQYQRHFDALLTDWREAGKITRVTPRADRVREISRQLHAVSTERPHNVGDCAARTVAGAPSGLSPCRSQAKPLIDYREGGDE